MTTDFKQLQLQLAAHFRDPENNPPPPKLEERRLNVYRTLFFKNITGFITNAFPVLHRLYNEESWLKLIRLFYATYQSHSPYFSQISKEFVNFLTHSYQLQANDPPFITELAHYEWVELALSVANPIIDWDYINRDGDLSNESVVISPLAWLLQYRWPVYKIRPEYRPQSPPEKPTFLVVCRNQKHKISFTALNQTTYFLLASIKTTDGKTGHEHIQHTIKKLNLPDTDESCRAAKAILQRMWKKEILLGTRIKKTN